MDLSQLNPQIACDNGAEFELLHPFTNEPLGVFIKVLGRESETFQDYIKSRVNESLKKNALSIKSKIPTVEGNEAESIELLVACTLGWRTGEVNTIEYEGENLSFSVANALKVYKSQKWIRAQVDNAIGNMNLFFQS